MKAKVDKVRSRDYIEYGWVKSLTHMFYVEKGLTDIRMVYNGTSSGLNDVLWAPHFGLPIMQHTLRSLRPGYFQCDMDVGEMFLNFWLNTSLRPYAGVDITHVQDTSAKAPHWEKERDRKWERWSRNFMGLTDSPYRSLQLMIKAKFIAYGDRLDAANPFQWSEVKLNLPGSPNYDPTWPWVYKARLDGNLACEVYVYVDDGRITGWCRKVCWKAARRFCSICNSLGIQDASRKRTEPSQTPGPWAGTVVHTKDGVVATVTSEKWNKTKDLFVELEAMMAQPSMSLVRLQQIRGFLIYVARTYRWLTPYIKGLHLTIDGWRKNRDKEGWPQKVQAWEWNSEEWIDVQPSAIQGATLEEAPETVTAVSRLTSDLAALKHLTSGEEPATQKCRSREKFTALYLMGDASGQGFGSGLWDKTGLWYDAANWAEHCRDETSNWKEATNLAVKIEEKAREGLLVDAELFVFTDNSVIIS